MDDLHGRIVNFDRKTIRRTMYYGEWWFVINDVVTALTGTKRPAKYIRELRERNMAFDRLFKNGDKGIPAPQMLEVVTSAGHRKLGCWNAEALYRLVQSVPSTKANQFKRWLAKVGYEQIRPADDPEVAVKKARALYCARGYSESWIVRRIQGMAVREELVGEWASRGIKGGQVYRALTNEIAKATFGMTPAEHRQLKKLTHQNLRDHMTNLEQVFSMLGEASTTEIIRNEDVRGYLSNYLAAKRGGRIAGAARKRLEKETGRQVVSKRNHLPLRVKNEQLKLTAVNA